MRLFLLFIASIVCFVSCGKVEVNKKDIITENSDARFVLNIDFSPATTKVTASENSVMVTPKWEVGDVVNIAVVQRGRAYYKSVTINKLSDFNAQVVFDEPYLNFNLTYDIYGFIGNGSWADQTSLTPTVNISQSTPSTNIGDAVRKATFVFSAKDLSGSSPRVSVKVFGNIIKYTFKNYCRWNQDVSSFGFRLQGSNALSQNISLNLTDGQTSGTQASEINFNVPLTHVLSGDSQSFYVNCVFKNYNETQRFYPKLVVNYDQFFTTNDDDHVVSLDNLQEGRMYKINVLRGEDEARLYTEDLFRPSLKPASVEDMSHYLNNWMSLYPDNYPFFKLLLPGTHDSEALDFVSGVILSASFYECQETHIADQMNKGVRALDIRLTPRDNGLWVNHGGGKTNTEFRLGILNPILNFLSANPTETIVMMVNIENSSDTATFNRRFSEIMNTPRYYDKLVPSVDRNTTLGDVRGKLILITRRDMRRVLNKGNFLDNWGDNTSGKIGILRYPGSDKATLFWVQDQYGSSTSFSAKQTAVRNAFYQSVGFYNRGGWTISYSSISGIPGSNAATMNPYIRDFLANNNIPFHGILYTDFITRGAGSRYHSETDGPGLMKQLLWNQFKNLTD